MSATVATKQNPYYSAGKLPGGSWQGWVDHGPTATAHASITEDPTVHPTRALAIASVKAQHPPTESRTP